MSRPKGPRAGWTVLVTGASSGLGRCLGLELARLGCRLVLTGRHLVALTAVADEVRAAGSDALVASADLALPSGPDTLLALVTAAGWTIDALANNAGAGLAGFWSEGDREADRSLVQLHCLSPMALTRALLPAWRERGRGALLNVASTGAFQPGPQTAVYYAAKAFLASWSLALAREERKWLAVTTLCPGALKTGFAAAAGRADFSGAPGPERTASRAVRAWRQGRGLVIPGWSNTLLVAASRWAPPAWSAAVVGALQSSVSLASSQREGRGT